MGEEWIGPKIVIGKLVTGDYYYPCYRGRYTRTHED